MKTLEHSKGRYCFLSIALGTGSRPTCLKSGLDLQLPHDFTQLLLRTPPWASCFPFGSINKPGFLWNLWSGCLCPLNALLPPLCLLAETQVSISGTGLGPRPSSHPTHCPLSHSIPNSFAQLAEFIHGLCS